MSSVLGGPVYGIMEMNLGCHDMILSGSQLNSFPNYCFLVQNKLSELY